MISYRTAALAPHAPVEIDRVAGSIRLLDWRVFGPRGETHCELFLRRILTVEGVSSVAIDTVTAVAVIQVQPQRVGSILPRLAGVIRGEGPELPPGALPHGAKGTRYQVQRVGSRLTSWQVREDRPGRLRLRHQLLRNDRVKARRVERLISLIPGVTTARESRWTGSVFVEYHPELVERDLLVHLAEQALADPERGRDGPPAAAEARMVIANVNLGVAAVADLGVTAFAPVAAFLLVGTNLKTFAEAAGQIGRKQLGLPVVYTSIVVGALANGQFLACAIMAWMYGYWKRRELDEVSTERQLLVEAHVAQPCVARKSAGSRETIIPCAQLRLGDRVVVKTGDVVPADGRVVSGAGVVDERSVSGIDGAARKRTGVQALAGSIVLFGQFQVEVERLGETTRAATIRRAVAEAIAPAVNKSAPLDRDHPGQRAVGPTLATAGLGLAVGDLGTAAAILAPDYATGPTLATSLLSIADVAQCLSRGIVVRDPKALDRLGQTDLLVIADHPGLEQPDLRMAAIDTPSAEVAGLIQLAGSVGRHLGGQRGSALVAASYARNLPLLNLVPIDLNGGIAVRYGQKFVRLRDNDEVSDDGPLSVEIDGQPVATIYFQSSSDFAAARQIERLRRDHGLRVVLATPRAEPDAARLANDLGADEYRAGLANGSLTDFLRQCRASGRRVALVGADRHVVGAANDAHVIIGVVEDGGALACQCPLTLLEPSLSPLVDVWDIATARSARTREAHRLTLVPNVLCVAGAFFLGFTSLAAVIVSNLGTFGSFSVAAEQLRRSHRIGRKWHRPLSTVSRGPSNATRHMD
jgi:cation transport ATPase